MRYHFDRAFVAQFCRFAAVGLSGTAIQYITLWLACDHFQILKAQIASAIGYILGSIANYILNYFFTFGSSKSHTEAAPKYFTILAVGWSINYILMGYLPAHQHWNHWLAQLLSTGVVLLWNFSGSRWWAFKHS